MKRRRYRIGFDEHDFRHSQPSSFNISRCHRLLLSTSTITNLSIHINNDYCRWCPLLKRGSFDELRTLRPPLLIFIRGISSRELGCELNLNDSRANSGAPWIMDVIETLYSTYILRHFPQKAILFIRSFTLSAWF